MVKRVNSFLKDEVLVLGGLDVISGAAGVGLDGRLQQIGAQSA